MNVSAGSVEIKIVFFLIQALPASAALARLFLIPRGNLQPRKGKLVPFDGLVFMFLCLLLLLDLFASRPSFKPEWIFLAAFVAAVYTLILSAEFSSHAAVRRFAAGILSPAPNLRWLVVSLLTFPILFAIGHSLGYLVPISPTAHFFYPGLPAGPSLGHVPLLLAMNAVFAGGLGGEPFWRGVLYARLRERRQFLGAAFRAGIAQAAWLAPCWLLIGYDRRSILLISALFVFVSPVFALVWEQSRRSLLATILLFGSMTTALNFIPLSFMTVGTVILFFPAVLLAKRRSRRTR